MKIERYCTCGKQLLVNVPKRKRDRALSVWYAEHSGPGHEDTNAAGAEAARMGTNTGMGRESERLAPGPRLVREAER